MSAAKIFSGTGSQGLAEQICKSYGSRLGKVNIQRFSDGEILPTFYGRASAVILSFLSKALILLPRI
jgi:hypothetical protein